MNVEPRSPGSSCSAISTFCSVSSPKSSSRLERREDRAVDLEGRLDPVGEGRRFEGVADRLWVDAVPARVDGASCNDGRVATVFCVRGGGRGSFGRAKRRRIVSGSDSGPAAAFTCVETNE